MDDEAVCHRCNPADLPGPSPSQYHATVFLVIIATIVVATAWLIVRG